MKRCNLKQKTLAKLAGIQPATLSSYLNHTKSGKQKGKNPSIVNAIEIAKALNVSLNWLCGLSDLEANLRKENADEVSLASYLKDWTYFLQKGHIYIEHVGRSTYGVYGELMVPGELILRVRLEKEEHPNYVLDFFENYRKLTELRDSAILSNELYESSLNGLIDKYKGYKITPSGEIVTNNVTL